MPADQNPNLIPFFPCTISAKQIFPDPAHLIDADPNQTNFKHLRLWRFFFFVFLFLFLSLSLYPYTQPSETNWYWNLWSIDEFPCHQHMGDSPFRSVIYPLEMTAVNIDNLIIVKDFHPEINFFPPNQKFDLKPTVYQGFSGPNFSVNCDLKECTYYAGFEFSLLFTKRS